MTNTSKLQESKRIWIIKYVIATVMMPIVIELESRIVIVSHEKKEIRKSKVNILTTGRFSQCSIPILKFILSNIKEARFLTTVKKRNIERKHTLN